MSVVKLYLIATPLGNLDDITLRALQTLRKVRHVFAEDSREVAKLLTAHSIPADDKKLHSYANHNMKAATDLAIRLLTEGNDVGFVSDRGTPAISDPGFLLVKRAREEGFAVVPIPGPSSPVATLSVAGIDSDRFVFTGFLPLQQKERDALFDGVAKLDAPACFFESPRRIRATAAELKRRFPMGRLFVGREITKIHEEFAWYDLETFDPEALRELGEYTCVLQPRAGVQNSEGWEAEVELRAATDKEWSKRIAEKYGIAAATAYNALQKIKPGKS